MSLHKLKRGSDLIEGIAALGITLGYYVKREFLVKNRRNGPAVDMAWMNDENQDFPLMIFEVETAAGNTIANNAIKVLGQPTTQFEKPLFFFHLVIKAGKGNSRLEALASAYGTNNYRIYSLDRKEKEKLLYDILGQHRRLTKTLNILTLHATLARSTWKEINLSHFFRRLENFNFAANYLREYAFLAKRSRAFLPNYLQRLALEMDQRCPFHGYGTFIGDEWRAPIHLALLAASVPARKKELIKRLFYWQTNKDYRSRIGPHFGLSRDYDEFILSLGAGLLAMIAALFGSPDVALFVAGEMQKISDTLKRAPARVRFYYWAWLLQVSASLSDGRIYRETKAHLDESGGISSQGLLSPPIQIPVYDECEWDKEIIRAKKPVPEARDLQKQRLEHLKARPERLDLHSLGLEVLTRIEDINDLSGEVVRLLSS